MLKTGRGVRVKCSICKNASNKGSRVLSGIALLSILYVIILSSRVTLFTGDFNASLVCDFCVSFQLMHSILWL